MAATLTYLVLNCVFIIGLALWWLLVRPNVNWRSILITLAVLFVCTALFDSLIVGLGIVDYDYAKTLGVTIGAAPIEDFFYAILSGLLVPAVWTILQGRHERKN